MGFTMLLKNFNVLVVDDVILMCDFLFGVAAQVADCKVFKALDGKTAAEILENEPIDLLITDIEMKSPTGLDLVARVRSGLFTATAHDIPVMIFSGNTYLDLIQQSISFDVNDFLAKPITAGRLSKKIKHHLDTEKLINTPEHYRAISAGLADIKTAPGSDQHQFRVSIVRELPQQAHNPDDEDNNGSSKSRDKDFLFWPENATTGYFQIDRRLRNLAFNVSCFHNVFINNCKTVAIESERKRACNSIEYLIHISKSFRRKEQRRDFWQLFNIRIEKLKPLVLELNQINVKHHQGVLALLKKIAYWWMQTCNRPIIQRNDENEGDDKQHA
jgi:YesN/AraC family two-component response regulator